MRRNTSHCKISTRPADQGHAVLRGHPHRVAPPKQVAVDEDICARCGEGGLEDDVDCACAVCFQGFHDKCPDVTAAVMPDGHAIGDNDVGTTSKMCGDVRTECLDPDSIPSQLSLGALQGTTALHRESQVTVVAVSSCCARSPALMRIACCSSHFVLCRAYTHGGRHQAASASVRAGRCWTLTRSSAPSFEPSSRIEVWTPKGTRLSFPNE